MLYMGIVPYEPTAALTVLRLEHASPALLESKAVTPCHGKNSVSFIQIVLGRKTPT